MGSATAAARITQDEVDALDQASNDLALAYQLIAEAKPRCAAHVLPLIYRANLAVVRTADKGAKAFVVYYRAHPPKRPTRLSRVVQVALSEAALHPTEPTEPTGE